LSRAQLFQWHAQFKTGHTSVDDNERTGRPTSCTTPETVALIQELIRQDRRLTIRDIAEEVKVGSGGRIGHALCRSQICAQDPDS
jgi:transposase